MIQKYKNFFVKITIVIMDIVLILISWVFSLYILAQYPSSEEIFTLSNSLLVFVSIHIAIYFFTGAYSLRYFESSLLNYRVLMTVLPIIIFFIFLISLDQYSMQINQTLITYLLTLSCLFYFSRLFIGKVFYTFPENILFIGDSDLIIEAYDHIKNKPERYNIIEKIKDLESIKRGLDNLSLEFGEVIFDEVIYSSNIDPHHIYNYFYDLSGIRTKSICDSISFYEKTFSRFPISKESTKYLVNSIYPKIYSSFILEKFKRFIDILFSIVGFCLFFPLFIIVSFLVYCSSPGPILFKQKRIGYRKKEFQIIKFRTLFYQSDDHEPSIIIDNDPRITRIGKFLRTFHLDEIPQLWNIFIGNLSVIGPRPIRKIFEDQYEKDIPYYTLRHTVKPGLTGWAQLADIDHRKVEGPRLRLQYDLFYIKNRSIFFEFIILLRTIRYLLLGKGV